ncbi:aminotransferase class IV [Pseudoxanthobacter sp.]|uniref:aminotransferase class IV n=1 Tax=Pseudoxanthobacter sp. TaxID=1925742 RepID=UPI002FE3C678
MIWFDGTVSETAVRPFDLADRGLLLSDGVFDTLAVFGGVPFRLEAHLARLQAAAAALGFAADAGEARQAVADLIAAAGGGRAVIRLTLTRGSGPRGLVPPQAPRPRLIAGLAPWNPALAFSPVRLATAAIRRNETSPAARLKTLAYLDNVLAFTAARQAGADDALFLNSRGMPVCSALANLFAFSGDTLLTAPPADGVLEGITRAAVIAVARALGLAVREAAPDPDRLSQGAAFLTNSVRLIMPVAAIDGAALPPHPAVPEIAAGLRRAIAAECGDDLT